ncbi:TetR family transcriptional regulator [Vitiosangium sp. GDMCC 1.1324]|uniref:TetR family transcriptional regulator n=1 Tax=Vitiosangium sp. (strain GDMCC 1.1324) TaxID=2138576 RepID=UPI000D3BF419|nr:TetR family transcriptional regulator [Vitiosangium sp. GDMCC 1.1324]PTL78792.1 TetR family transcriptional regulator [Vitiosangium sp. GDMCC 1.1324]
MSQDAPPDTRARILQVALDEFAVRGYHATSIREIAERVGVTKTAVLYHFPGKAELLGALAEPMLDDLDTVLAATGAMEPVQARWAVIEGVLEVWLTHRRLLRMNLHDMAMAAAAPVFERFRDAMMRANALVAGPAPDFTDKVTAAQVIGMLADPVVLFADAPTEALRASVLRGVRRVLGGKEPRVGAVDRTASPAAGQARRPARARRGRPSTMSPEMAETAQRMYAEGATAEEIAEEMGVSRATVYRHLGSEILRR